MCKSNASAFRNLESVKPHVKHLAAKRFVECSLKHPQDHYNDIGKFIKILESDDKNLQLLSLKVLGNMAHIDSKSRLVKVLPKLFEVLNQGDFISNHAIETLGKIAQAKPELREKITKELLKVEYYKHQKEENRNIAIGKVLLALKGYVGSSDRKVLNFIKRQIGNPRNATAKKAQDLLRHIT